MKNLENQIVKKNSKKENLDSVNLENVKVNVSKGEKSLISKNLDSISVKRSIYNIPMELKGEEKKFRGKIRRELKRFVSSILGKDRNEEERTKGISEFLKFYKKNWKIQNFKIEDFTNSTNEGDKKDYLDLLNYVKSTLEK
jgi:hypothetical protein